MRLAALPLLLAQLRPVVGILLCVVVGPNGGAGEGDCETSSHDRRIVAGIGQVVREAGEAGETGCTLTDLCRPVAPAPYLVTPPPTVLDAATAAPGAVSDRWYNPVRIAPPTPPPNA